MTRDEKIEFYDKIEKALKIEHPILKGKLTQPQILEFFKAIKGDVSEDNDTLEEVENHLKEIEVDIKEAVKEAEENDEDVTVDELNEL